MDDIISFFGMLLDAVISFFSVLFSAVMGFCMTIWNGIVSLFHGGLSNIMDGIMQWLNS